MSKRTTSPGTDAAGTFTPPSGVGSGPRGVTPAGTERFRGRHADGFLPDHFRQGPAGLTVSSLGVGTYLGADADGDDEAYVEAIRLALRSGINVVDTAINYRCQRSERAIGRALQSLLTHGPVARDEIVICTKAGYVPLEDCPPATREGYQGYLRREFYARRIMTPEEVVAGGHCVAPAFLADCLRRSRQNLGVEMIDVFYLHNPEQQLASVSAEELRRRLRSAFAMLEERVATGEIGMYGVSTWQGFRVAPQNRGHLSIRELVAIAEEVAGATHSFRVAQMPISLAMPEGVRLPMQAGVNGDALSPVDAARDHGLTVIASAPLMQGQLTRSLPDALHALFPRATTDAQRAIGFVRSLPGVTTALVGMKQQAHVTENLGAVR
jgi:aryl-alcohol dehydrogenase-like predicted oxidoreductase